jgi:hypothetical protein
MNKRLALLAGIAVCGLAALSGPAEARYWRHGGWGGYPYGGWGPTFYGGGPYGPGWYNPYAYYYVPPPPRPDPAYAQLSRKCPGGRVPARWIKVKVQGQVVYNHVMGRCR